MRQTVGMIAGGFKPFTQGHFSLVERASTECDKVYLFISTKDRFRPGELGLTWSAMQKIWEKFLLKAMPSNVEVKFTDQPIREIIDILRAANADEYNTDTFLIYSDPEDIAKNYPQRARDKYMNRLIANHQLDFREVDRSLSQGISGTKMRAALKNKNVEAFISGLPRPVQVHGLEIFNMLFADVREG